MAAGTEVAAASEVVVVNEERPSDSSSSMDCEYERVVLVSDRDLISERKELV